MSPSRLHRFPSPCPWEAARLSHNLGRAECRCVRAAAASPCLNLSLNDRCKDLALVQLAAHVGPTTAGGIKRQVQLWQNKIKNIFLEQSDNWSRNNLIAPSRIRLDFQGPWNYEGQRRDRGRGGRRTRVFSLVCGWIWRSINEQRGKKRQGNWKTLWLVGWSLNGETPRRDRSLISAISSTLGTTSVWDTGAWVRVWVADGGNTGTNTLLRVLHKS